MRKAPAASFVLREALPRAGSGIWYFQVLQMLKTQRPRLPTAERSLLADSLRYRVPVGSAVGRVRAYEQRVQPASEAKSEALKDAGVSRPDP